MTKMTIKKRWHAIDDQFEQAIKQDDLPAITHVIEKTKWLREEDARWADYFHCLLRLPCQYTHLVALEKLIEAGADINKVNVFGDEFIEPPLQIAIQEVNLALLEYLIFPRKGMKRADLEVPFIWEGQNLPQRPLMFAVECHHEAKRKALYAHPPEHIPKLLEIIRLLISAGADVNGILPSWASSVETLDDEPSANDDPTYFVLSFEYDGKTLWFEFDLPQTALSLTSDPQVIKMLLDAGADPNLDGRGEPLKRAVQDGKAESVALLLNAGIRIPNDSLWSERSLLDTAAEKGYTEIYELLRHAMRGATHHN